MACKGCQFEDLVVDYRLNGTITNMFSTGGG